MECIGQVEIDPYCRAVLAKHWPNVKRMEDVREVKAGCFGTDIDLVAGGFPCQDISAAGKGKGIYAERSGLWWEMRRIIGETRPAWVLAENVPALRTRGADDVLASLEELGYSCWPLVVGAWAVGAPHLRERVWLIAHAAGESSRLQVAGDSRGQPKAPWASQASSLGGRSSLSRKHEWRTEPQFCRVVDGVRANVDRNERLGNAVVPQVAEVIGRAIMEASKA